MESDTEDDIKTAAAKCAHKFDIPIDQINTCLITQYGNTIQHDMAVKTEALNPPHKYVPWVTLNGVHTEEIEQQAMDNLIKLICDTYKVRFRKILIEKWEKSFI